MGALFCNDCKESALFNSVHIGNRISYSLTGKTSHMKGWGEGRTRVPVSSGEERDCQCPGRLSDIVINKADSMQGLGCAERREGKKCPESSVLLPSSLLQETKMPGCFHPRGQSRTGRGMIWVWRTGEHPARSLQVVPQKNRVTILV